MRIITLPNQRPVSLGEFVRCWKVLKILPSDRMVANFDYFPARADEILAKISYGVHDRINRHIPNFCKGRKWENEWQGDVSRFANRVNSRIVTRPGDVPFEFRARLAHRITFPDQE